MIRSTRANYASLTGTMTHTRQVFGNARFVARLGWQDAASRISSAGRGFRFTGSGGLVADIDWARALRDGTHVLEGDERYLFRVTYGF